MKLKLILRCKFCKTEDVFYAVSGQWPTVREFYICRDHFEQGRAKIKGCQFQSVSCLVPIRLEDLKL